MATTELADLHGEIRKRELEHYMDALGGENLTSAVFTLVGINQVSLSNAESAGHFGSGDGLWNSIMATKAAIAEVLSRLAPEELSAALHDLYDDEEA